MAVILAFILILWAWGRFESLAICTGHRNGSKIDFLFDAYFGVDGCPRMVEKMETLFRRGRGWGGLHNRYYWQQCESQISKGFYC